MFEHLSQVNFLAVLVATFASFGLGGWWYSLSTGFGRAWLAAIGKAPSELGSPTVPMTLTFISTFFTGIVMAILINVMNDDTFYEGARLGFVLGLGIVAPSMFSDHVFCSRPLTLFFIQAGYRVVLLTIMGAIIGAWG